MNKIEQAKACLQATRPRSRRRIVLERDLVRLVVRQLRLENRKERAAARRQRTN